MILAPHVKIFVGRTTQVLGFVRVISRVTWSVSPELSLLVFLNLIRAIQELETSLFANAVETNLKRLDGIQARTVCVLLSFLSCLRSLRV